MATQAQSEATPHTAIGPIGAPGHHHSYPALKLRVDRSIGYFCGFQPNA